MKIVPRRPNTETVFYEQEKKNDVVAFTDVQRVSEPTSDEGSAHVRSGDKVNDMKNKRKANSPRIDQANQPLVFGGIGSSR